MQEFMIPVTFHIRASSERLAVDALLARIGNESPDCISFVHTDCMEITEENPVSYGQESPLLAMDYEYLEGERNAW